MFKTASNVLVGGSGAQVNVMWGTSNGICEVYLCSTHTAEWVGESDPR